MEFVTRFPKVTGGYNSIFLVVDKLTKITHLIPIKPFSTASNLAQLFVKEIIILHDILARIISDRDAKFASKFWQALF